MKLTEIGTWADGKGVKGALKEVAKAAKEPVNIAPDVLALADKNKSVLEKVGVVGNICVKVGSVGLVVSGPSEVCNEL